MASIKAYTLKNGLKRYEVYISNGINKGTGNQNKIHKKGFLSYLEAEKFAKITEGQLADNDYLKENAQKMRIEDYLNEWIENYKQAVKEGTRIVHRNNIKRYISPYIGKFKLEDYTSADHQKFINKLLKMPGIGRSGQGLSVVTVKSVNATLSSAFSKALKLGYLRKNPTLFTEFPREKKKKKAEFRYYTIEETDTFLEFAQKEKDPMWFPFFTIIFDQGLRKSEAMGLVWQDIDFSKKEVNIERQRLGQAETGKNRGKIVIDDTKTESSERVLPITERTKTALLSYRNHIIKLFGYLPLTEDGDQFIFINSRGKSKGSPLKDRSTNTAYERIRLRADLKHITVHDFRHTFAVRMRQAGVSLEDIKDMLGHKNVTTTQIYAHISPEVKERSMDKLENYLLEHKKKHSI